MSPTPNVSISVVSNSVVHCHRVSLFRQTNLILPDMPTEEDCVQFEEWKITQRHPIVICVYFETPFVKTDEDKGENTKIVHKHGQSATAFWWRRATLYRWIFWRSMIYRGCERLHRRGRHFVETTVTEIMVKIENLLKTNMPINITTDDIQAHETVRQCNLCKIDFHLV